MGETHNGEDEKEGEQQKEPTQEKEREAKAKRGELRRSPYGKRGAKKGNVEIERKKISYKKRRKTKRNKQNVG